jgi:hypothetical protein
MKTAMKSHLIIKVDRSIRPAYPDWEGGVRHWGIDRRPAEYNLGSLALCRTYLMPKGGDKVTYFQDKGIIHFCLGFADFSEIQRKLSEFADGVDVFRSYFGDEPIFALYDPIKGTSGCFKVSSLRVWKHEIIQEWQPVCQGFSGLAPHLAGESTFCPRRDA